MPKNMFQRPQQATPSRNVPRHGAPLPPHKVQARKLAQAKPEATLSLPALEALLKAPRR